MANQGCPNEGSDTRLFGRWGCRIQSACSFHWMRPPIELLFRLPILPIGWRPVEVSLRFPFYLGICIPLLPEPPVATVGKYFSLRVGFRWDPFWPYGDGTTRQGGYIFPEAILKVKNQPLV